VSKKPIVGCSVKGPTHIGEGMPCQDAWLGIYEHGIRLAIVCDGMGSKPWSREGAQAATRSARTTWRLWRKGVNPQIEDFIRLFEVIWRLEVSKLQQIIDARPTPTLHLAATTCLIYAEDMDGNAFMAQLGDGLIVHQQENGLCTHLIVKRDFEFNHTIGLGIPHNLQDWTWKAIPSIKQKESILMVTDGISEDLNLTQLPSFINWLFEEIVPSRAPATKLAHELRAWPVPYHTDDKTLLLTWKN
jgi:serine/threonine protein phosphatase PrpC